MFSRTARICTTASTRQHKRCRHSKRHKHSKQARQDKQGKLNKHSKQGKQGKHSKQARQGKQVKLNKHSKQGLRLVMRVARPRRRESPAPRQPGVCGSRSAPTSGATLRKALGNLRVLEITARLSLSTEMRGRWIRRHAQAPSCCPAAFASPATMAYLTRVFPT